MKPTIVVINESTVLKDEQIIPVVAALQLQVTRDFAPIWNQDAEIIFSPDKTNLPTQWQLVVLDDSDQAEDLGYHELTAAGLPIGKVFAKSDLNSGTSWSVTMSHEVLEMLADPWINTCIEFDAPSGYADFYAMEVCDPCEADAYSYTIGRIAVSDFVTPQWFMATAIGVQFDFGKRIVLPFQLLPGGYIGMYNMYNSKKWTQITADASSLIADPSEAKAGSRRDRRNKNHNHWRHSLVRK